MKHVLPSRAYKYEYTINRIQLIHICIYTDERLNSNHPIDNANITNQTENLTVIVE